MELRSTKFYYSLSSSCSRISLPDWSTCHSSRYAKPTSWHSFFSSSRGSLTTVNFKLKMNKKESFNSALLWTHVNPLWRQGNRVNPSPPKVIMEFGEVAKGIRTLATLPEDTGLATSTHLVAHIIYHYCGSLSVGTPRGADMAGKHPYK